MSSRMEQIIEEIEDYIDGCKTPAISRGKILVNREEIEELLTELRTKTPEEIKSLPWGARLMTLECGMRFLADFLQGDVYFKTAYPEHNLVRARTQFRLVKEMEEQFDEMNEILKKYI